MSEARKDATTFINLIIYEETSTLPNILPKILSVVTELVPIQLINPPKKKIRATAKKVMEKAGA